MSQENVAVVRQHFEVVNKGDFSSAMATYDEHVVLVVDESAVPTNAGTFTGQKAVGEWFADWFRSFARGYRFQVEEIKEVGERVFAIVHHRGRGRSSAVALDWSLAYAYTIHAGKIARLEMYAKRADALKAVGLEE